MLVIQLCLTLCDLIGCSPPGFSVSGQEYWSRLLFPSPKDRPNPGNKPRSPTLQVDSLSSESPGKPYKCIIMYGSDSEESACSAEDLGSIPWSGRSPGGGIENPLQYSCLGNSMDRGTCQATVHRVAKSRTRLSNLYVTRHYRPPRWNHGRKSTC